MKNIKTIIISLLAVVFLGGCTKDLEDSSRITYYPIITVNGEPLITMLVGGSYTDAGAKAFAGETELTVVSEGTVDASTPGVYTISYTAENVDGFSSKKFRYVGVMTQEALDDNLTGKYQRTAGKKGISTWTKTLPGLYKATDVGGADLQAQYVYVFNIKKNIIVVPTQALGGTGTDVTTTNADGSANIPFVPGPIGTTSYKWVVINSGYGTALRQFKKVE